MSSSDIPSTSPKPLVIGGLIGGAVALVALFLALIATEAGHGNYGLVIALFPISLLAVIDGTITPTTLILACVQFPLYGIVIGYCAMRKRAWVGAGIVVLVHIVAIAVCFSTLQ